ncbi:MAG: alpha-E domain-containing protein [Thalassobaculum sp.]|uniref:alpha-E domain-containing protein n=1 Tax=Thalassobaculum sp. TaxID=2022740 RepID=UPI0032ED3CFB
MTIGTKFLLARYADCSFWLGRYMERAESLARILDVNLHFSRDSRGSQNWRSIVQLNADEERFDEAYDVASYANVVHFYVLDRDNPSSIISTIRAAKENARALRPTISTEMWSHLNVFNNTLSALTSDDLKYSELSRVCAMIKEECQTHTGITEGTFFRDQTWYFYLIGREVERADQTSRLLDIKYHLLLPPNQAVGSPVDVSQWNAMLRSVAGYHAFRREHPRGMSPKQVAAFLLFNMSFPRSIALCLSEIDGHLHRLRSGFGLRAGASAMEILDETRAALADHSPDTVIQFGLHQFSDYVQRQLIAVTAAVRAEFCGVVPEQNAA